MKKMIDKLTCILNAPPEEKKKMIMEEKNSPKI